MKVCSTLTCGVCDACIARRTLGPSVAQVLAALDLLLLACPVSLYTTDLRIARTQLASYGTAGNLYHCASELYGFAATYWQTTLGERANALGDACQFAGDGNTVQFTRALDAARPPTSETPLSALAAELYASSAGSL